MDDILVLDQNFVEQDILDLYYSFLWTERYCGYGDFEIYTPMNFTLYQLLREDYYLKIKDSDNLMIIEKRHIKSDSENGDQLIVTGRSLESILDRRIVWEQTILSGDFQTNLAVLLLDNAIDALIPERNISLLDYELSEDPRILELDIEKQITGTNLYTVIKSICESIDMGFKITRNSSNQFIFKFYYGEDRSYDQILNPWVIFSKKFDNIVNSDYIFDKRPFKTVSLVLGAGEGSERKGAIAAISTGAGSDLNRREMHTDAREISEEYDGLPIPEQDYLAQLVQKGNEDLKQNDIYDVFEGEVQSAGSFVYGKDFWLGDIVQVENEYGDAGKARVEEIIRSKSPAGSFIYPTFKTVE